MVYPLVVTKQNMGWAKIMGWAGLPGDAHPTLHPSPRVGLGGGGRPKVGQGWQGLGRAA